MAKYKGDPLTDAIRDLGFNPRIARALRNAVVSSGCLNLHPDDMASQIWLALKEREQKGYHEGLTESQMIFPIGQYLPEAASA